MRLREKCKSARLSAQFDMAILLISAENPQCRFRTHYIPHRTNSTPAHASPGAIREFKGKVKITKAELIA